MSAIILHFLSLGLFLSSLLFQHLQAQSTNLHNWAGTFAFSTQNIQWPRTVQQIQHIVKNARKIRCIGQRHSFSPIADSNDTLLSMVGLRNIFNPLVPSEKGALIGINPADPTVWVQAGLTYTDLAPYLQYTKYALPNLASLGDVSVAGATQTGAHGSGNSLGALATQIRGVRLVRADGIERRLSRGDRRLGAIATGLGAFGVVTAVELALIKSYSVINNVFLNLPHDQFIQNFDAIMAAGYSVQVFANFLVPGIWNQVWVTVRSDDPNSVDIGQQEFLLNTSAKRTMEQVSPMAFMPPTYLSKQGVEQPWHFGLVDYQLGILSGADYRNSISGISGAGDEIMAEYFVAQENGTKAIEALYQYSAQLGPVLWYALVRTVKCDQIWLSPSRCRTPNEHHSVALHFTFKPDLARVNPVLEKVERALAPFGARPHWAKHFLMDPRDFLHTYEKRAEFITLAKKFDPTGKFRNDFLDKYVFADIDDDGNGKGYEEGDGEDRGEFENGSDGFRRKTKIR